MIEPFASLQNSRDVRYQKLLSSGIYHIVSVLVLYYEYTQFYLGANYDIDGTGFNTIESSRRGALEIHFRYTITDVKPLKHFKVCPIY